MVKSGDELRCRCQMEMADDIILRNGTAEVGQNRGWARRRCVDVFVLIVGKGLLAG